MSGVIYSFILYLLYVLVPIIPAAILFRMFPDTTVAVKGPLQKLTVRATGAFAAYIVTVVLGYALIQNVERQIELAQSAAWTVTVPVKFVDHDNKPIAQGVAIEYVNFDPQLKVFRLGSANLYVTIFPTKPGEWPIVSLGVAGFQPSKVDLQEIIDRKVGRTVEVDQFNRVIKLNEAVTLTAIDPHFVQSPYSEAKPLDPVGGGP